MKSSQARRLTILLIELLVLGIISYLAFGSAIPPAGPDGFWFYTALLNLMLGSRLITPFYSKPADSITFAITALVALLLVSQWSAWTAREQVVFLVAVGLLLVFVLVGVLQVYCKDSTGRVGRFAAELSRLTLTNLGTPQVIFSVLIFFSLFTFHIDSGRELLWVSVAWVLLVASSPVEAVFNLYDTLRNQLSGLAGGEIVGSIAGFESPGVILVRTTDAGHFGAGDLVVARDSHSGLRYGRVLDHVGRHEGDLVRTLELNCDVGDYSVSGPPDSVWRAREIVPSPRDKRTELIDTRWTDLVGVVANETSLSRLYFEVSDDADLEEGRLVETLVGDELVTYQVIEGLTKEEVVHQKNTRGYARAQAQKIGIWDTTTSRFRESKWIPPLNQPVWLRRQEDVDLRALAGRAIGRFPGTPYFVELDSVDELVTHNTAILGILGIGKSMLSIELVERMLAHGVKVVCLDLTNQYASELEAFLDKKDQANSLQRLQMAGETDSEQSNEYPERGGSWRHLRDAIRVDLDEFLVTDNPRMLRIYSPAQVAGTKQLSERKQYKNENDQWQRGAALWSVTPVEVTQLVTEEVLSHVQDEMSNQARVCLVYEEAHSLVPEWNTVSNERDRVATNATARAILQGRKYGMGCMVVTQRTASVTKTILNQCNTVFAMRTFDDTGKDFLSNFVGRDYANTLPNLSERQAIAFGRASSCENPVLLRLNDRRDFLEGFRAVNPAPDKTQWCELPARDYGDGRQAQGDNDAPADFDDEITF